jgi:flagellar hook protein FlgE
MLRSMYSGITGMKNFQTKLDVIGNNIANVDTYGFKKGRVTFKDAISQTTAGASAGTPGSKGGTNPLQVGLGSTVASIDTVDTQSSMQNTGRGLDLAINGDGYFTVTDGTNTYYTRAGNFYLDNSGNLVTSEGYNVEDASGNYPINIPTDSQSYSINSKGEISVVAADGTTSTLGPIGVAKFPNPSGLTKVGGNLYQISQNSGSATLQSAGTGGTGSIASGFLEMSNVDLSEEFTEMIVAQRGFQANSRIITTSDEILQELLNLKH